MAAEAEASREAKAKIIAAQGEMNAAKNLKEAADTIASSSGLKICYIQPSGQGSLGRRRPCRPGSLKP